MLTGLTLTLMTGLLWMGVGIVFSLGSAKCSSQPHFLGRSMAFSACAAWILLPDYSQSWNCSPVFVVFLLITGAISSAGSLAMQRAMQTGNHGICWSLGQSAMILPFLSAVLFFNERLMVWNIPGILLILSGIILLGTQRKSESAANSWLLWAFTSFALLGFSQILTLFPSHFGALHDHASLRVPLLMTGGAVMLCFVAYRSPRPNAWQDGLRYSACLTLLVLPGQFTLYRAMDQLTSVGCSMLVYPLAITVCTLGFTAYSFFHKKESYNRRSILAIAACIAGILLLGIRSAG